MRKNRESKGVHGAPKRIMELHEDLRERLQQEKNNDSDANVPDDDHDDGL